MTFYFYLNDLKNHDVNLAIFQIDQINQKRRKNTYTICLNDSMVFSYIHRKKNTCIHTNCITHGILIVTNSMVKQYIRVEFSCRKRLLYNCNRGAKMTIKIMTLLKFSVSHIFYWKGLPVKNPNPNPNCHPVKKISLLHV